MNNNFQPSPGSSENAVDNHRPYNAATREMFGSTRAYQISRAVEAIQNGVDFMYPEVALPSAAIDSATFAPVAIQQTVARELAPDTNATHISTHPEYQWHRDGVKASAEATTTEVLGGDANAHNPHNATVAREMIAEIHRAAAEKARTVQGATIGISATVVPLTNPEKSYYDQKAA